jgi:hypothetical protein
MALTRETLFHCKFVHPQDRTIDPLDMKQRIKPLDQRDCMLYSEIFSVTVNLVTKILVDHIQVKALRH